MRAKCTSSIIKNQFSRRVGFAVLFQLFLSLGAQKCIAQAKNVTAMNETLQFAGPAEDNEAPAWEEFQLSGAWSTVASGAFRAIPHAPASALETSNAFLILQKNKGVVQFLLQGGSYTMSTLGSGGPQGEHTEKNSFGTLPHAYLSVHPDESWSLQAGKLLSMPGFENPFTYQNQNIQRGLLENQNNTISRGLQLNYTGENTTFFGTLNDGFYSGELKWVGAGGSYRFNDRNSSNVMLGGAFKTSGVHTDTTPLLQNNSRILNIVHNIKWGIWSITPYYQYTQIPSNDITALISPANTKGYAMMVNDHIDLPATRIFPAGSTLHLPLRLEYIKANDYKSNAAQQVVFGPKSEALSLTFTPTLQKGIFFARTEWSWIQARHALTSPNSLLGNSRDRVSKFLLELGILY